MGVPQPTEERTDAEAIQQARTIAVGALRRTKPGIEGKLTVAYRPVSDEIEVVAADGSHFTLVIERVWKETLR